MSLTTLSGTLRRDRHYIGDVIALETLGDHRYFIMSDGSRQDASQTALEFRPEPTPVKADPGWYARVQRTHRREEWLEVAAWLYTASGSLGDALVISRSGRPTRLSRLLHADPSILHVSLQQEGPRLRPANQQPSVEYIVRRVLSDGGRHDRGEVAEHFIAASHHPDEIPLTDIAQQLGAISAALRRHLNNGASR